MTTDDLIRRLATAPAPRGRTPAPMLAGAVLAAGLAAVLLVLWRLGARPDLIESLGGGAAQIKFLGGGLLSLAGFAAASALAEPGRRVPLGLVLAGGIGTVLLGAGLVIAAPVTAPLASVLSSLHRCTGPIMALGLIPLGATFLALHRAAPIHPALAGLAAGGLSGAVAAMAFALSCPADDVLFVALAYGTAVAGLALFGAAAGWRLLRW